MTGKRVCIGAATVVMLVILRLSLGWHFLYEGVWKIENAAKFTAEPFLSEAKGPVAPLFYAMLDDIDGTKHLIVEVDENDAPRLNAKGRPVVKAESTLAAWQEFKDRVAGRYHLTDEQKARADKLYKQYESWLGDYLDENAEKIVGYFDSLRRFRESQAQGGNGAGYNKKRTWDKQQELRKEVKGWLTEIGAAEKGFKDGLWDLLDEEQQDRGYFGDGWNPFLWSRAKQINFAVTYGLTAIGLCLMLGLFTRLAALGGAAFMCFVVLSQPSWPLAIYPPPGPESGHALLIDKNFVEMVALLLVATTLAGRWGGLDALLSRWLPFPLGARKCKCQCQSQQEQATKA